MHEDAEQSPVAAQPPPPPPPPISLPPPMPAASPVSPPPPPLTPQTAVEQPQIPEPGTFYKFNSSRVTLREFAFGTKNPLTLLIAGITKMLRIRLPGSSDDPNVETLAPFETGDAAFPEEARVQLAPIIHELAGLGFHTPVFHQIVDPLSSTHHCMVSFIHPSGQAVARAHLRIWRQTHPAKVFLFTEFITAFTDETFLWSLSSKPDMIAPAGCRTNRRQGMSPGELWQSHLAELAKERDKPILSAADRYELIDVVERHHAALRDFHLWRGVFVPLSDADRRHAATLQANERALVTSGLQHAEVLAELEKLQNQRTGWGSTILILVVSVSIFLGAGRSLWSWETLLILMGVLLFHELGHYITMRIFGYRNLRMFFIPFVGAAVSGRNYNVPGWKKVIVSLMGPVPGIILGAIIGMLGIILERPQMVTVGVMALILNGFNLLPVLPLDGGWVMHALLFSRHHLLDVTFRFAAALILLAGGYFSGDRFLMIIGGFMLLALPMAYKLARLTSDLRGAGMQGVSPDDQTIPAPVAQTIITRIKEAFPRGMNNKMIAQHTLHVFETLNARPPGVLASVGLGFVHGGSFLAALLFAVLLVMQQRGGLDAFRRFNPDNLPDPKYTLDVDAIREGRAVGAVVPADPAARITIIASFPVQSDAEQMFARLMSDPASGALVLFGQSILATIPGDEDERRRSLFDRLQSRTDDTFVDHTEMRAAMQFSCVAPDEAAAQKIRDELNEYLHSARLHLIPPWSPEDSRSPEQRARHGRARRTWRRLNELRMTALSDPALRALFSEQARARRQGDRAAVAAHQEQYEKLIEEIRMREIEKLRAAADTDETLDAELIDRYGKLPGAQWSEQWMNAAVSELGPLMGQVAMAGEKPLAGADRYGAFGFTGDGGAKIRFYTLSFISTPDGAPAFARWLKSRGCSDFRYQFHSSEGAMEELEDQL